MAHASDVWEANVNVALGQLETSEFGLTSEEASRRLESVGPNELNLAQGDPPLAILLRQFRSALIYILLVAAAVSVALRELIDAGAIAAVLVFNASIGFTQELRASHAIQALDRLVPVMTTVMRDGVERVAESRELVPGDIVTLKAGARVPADLRLLDAAALEADESMLTGESIPVTKSVSPPGRRMSPGERRDVLFGGTVVTRGKARAVVVTTGIATELGRIAGSVAEAPVPRSPLELQMARLARTIGIAVLVVSVVAFSVGVSLGEPGGELLLTLVALAVSAIPEGLPIVLTITLAVGVRRMASRHAIIRRLSAVETLGSCTIVGTDKTGTLTQNRMTVSQVWAGRKRFAVSGAGYRAEGLVTFDGKPVDMSNQQLQPLLDTFRAGVLCNDASIVLQGSEYETFGDPTEVALLISGAKFGIKIDELQISLPRGDEIPFESEAQFAATVHTDGNSSLVVVKGAPERVVGMCSSEAGSDSLDRDSILAEAHRMAGDGLRVLAMAGLRDADNYRLPAGAVPSGLTFLGLQGMIDPPRAEAADAVRQCQAAGIRVLMVTGDHAATALAIAKQLGIADEQTHALSGHEIDQMNDDELYERLGEFPVCARTSPQNKLRIVTVLQRHGAVVAMTGDGVNDAPALRAAHIGAAMGLSGTDVAREASEMVVADDNFATIFEAVREGRVVFENVRKATFYLVSSGVAEVIAVLASILLGWKLPFVPAQLLWLNVVTNGVQDIGLAFEPSEPDILDHPPRPAREPVVSRLLWERTAIAAIVMAVGTLLLFRLELEAGHSIERARTVALTSMVLFQVFHVGNCRSERRSVFQLNPLSNPVLLLGTATAVLLHVAALGLGPMQTILRVEPIDLAAWGRIAAVALTVVAVVEIHKRIRRSK